MPFFMPSRDLLKSHNVAVRFVQLVVLSLSQPHLLFLVCFWVLFEFPHKSMCVELFFGLLRKLHHEQLPALPLWVLRLLQLDLVFQLH